MRRFCFRRSVGLVVCLGLLVPRMMLAAWSTDDSFDELAERYRKDVHPLLVRLCVDCHSSEDRQGELDLEQFQSLSLVRRDPGAWLLVPEMLQSGEMPPEGEPQPTAAERDVLSNWAKEYLRAEARSRAGDPGPVVLRRLNNVEYTNTIRDLTGTMLSPAREFPADGAAGEGFTNVGGALAMSPAMAEKYLQAAQEIAAHAVLLPGGIRFSERSSRRDWTNEIVAEIRAIYDRYTSGHADVSGLDRWRVKDPSRLTDHDGRVDLRPYLAALIDNRDAVLAGRVSLSEVARRHGVNAKYLGLIGETLCSEPTGSLVLDDLRLRFRKATPEGVAGLASVIGAWQEALWSYNAVGHFGLIRPWQTPDDPVSEQVVLRQPVPGVKKGQAPPMVLVAGTAGDAEADLVVWHRPRIEFKDRPAVLLRDVAPLVRSIRSMQEAALPRTADYLMAAAEVQSGTALLEAVATQRELNPALLRKWIDLVGFATPQKRTVAGHLKNRITKVGGYDALNGWDAGGLPSLITNRSGEVIEFSTITMPPRSVAVHPLPQAEVAVVWRSPIAEELELRGLVADADGTCGNGAAWRIELTTVSGVQVLSSGAIDNGRDAAIAHDAIGVAPGDLIALVVSARDENHVCDTTRIDLTLRESGSEGRRWNLTSALVDDVLEGNPQGDEYGHPEVWHAIRRESQKQQTVTIPPGTALAAWREAVLNNAPASETRVLAEKVQSLLSAGSGEPDSPEVALRRLVIGWHGPLGWRELAARDLERFRVRETDADGPGEDLFGSLGDSRDPISLRVRAGTVLKIPLPSSLVAGGEFVVEGRLDQGSAASATVQLWIQQQVPDEGEASALRPGTPVLTGGDGEGRDRVVAAFDEFRRLFPASLCYPRIVPVDVGVTLVLFHREDDALKRLMLPESEAERLDSLWEELRFVSQDAFTMETGYEQLMEFATQGGDPTRYEPLREPVRERVERLRDQLSAAEPVHRLWVRDFARRAWRRSPPPELLERLDALYEALRKEQSLSHDEAIRMLIARVLTSPLFLYRLETSQPGTEPTLVTPHDLAVRLSYFLWSTMPDERLRQLADSGEILNPDVPDSVARQMLADDRSQQLASEFFCQWLQIRDFLERDEKNAALFPEFSKLREDMLRESILCFADLIQNDRSILTLLAPERTFVNRSLAEHYGLDWDAVEGKGAWREVASTPEFPRGGVLTMATTLSTQSGASRTSPILRGTWVSEVLLGERMPRPPPDVPVLADAPPEGLSERELIQQHSSVASCARCHVRIDPYGFALEGFDAIGRFRTKDATGGALDLRATLPDGYELDGVEGLRDYLLTVRREDFVRQFCRKLLGYALGRQVILSDMPLLEEMTASLEANDYRFSAAVIPIVRSPQFRMIRGADFEDPFGSADSTGETP